MRFLTIREVIRLHAEILAQSGGAVGIRDLGALDSSLAQPFQTFGGEDLYPTIIEKAAALGFFLVMNHPFVDGNKRIGHAALEVTLVLNGFELDASADDQEGVILALASGTMTREDLTKWVVENLKSTSSEN